MEPQRKRWRTDESERNVEEMLQTDEEEEDSGHTSINRVSRVYRKLQNSAFARSQAE